MSIENKSLLQNIQNSNEFQNELLMCFLTAELSLDSNYECSICYEEYQVSEMIIFSSCNHIFCKECFVHYVEANLSDRKVVGLKCLSNKCETEIPYHFIQNLLSIESFERYEKILLESAIDEDPNISWCPRPNCNNAVIGALGDPHLVCDSCNHHWCSLCNQPWKENHDCITNPDQATPNDPYEKEFSKWAKKNTRPCPQCKSKIEKINGCNHMTCKRCHHQFCWLCGGTYTSNHFNPVNLLGCPAMGNASENFGMGRRAAVRVGTATGIVVGGALVIALAAPAAIIAGTVFTGIVIHNSVKKKLKRY